MNEKELQTALKQLKDVELQDFINITVGLANVSYRLTTSNGQAFVVRHLILQTPANARIEAKLQQILNRHGVATPTYLELKTGDVVGNVDGKHFTISANIDGHSPSAVTLALVRSIGETLAKIHNSLTTYDTLLEPSPTQWMRLDNVEREVEACSEDVRKVFKQLLDKSKDIIASSLPKSVIHSDLFLDNLFEDDGKVAVVFDFETAEYTIRLLDIARSYLALVHDGTLEPRNILNELLVGYNMVAEQPLTTDEVQSLPKAIVYAAVACASWLHNNNGERFVNSYIQSARLAEAEL